MQAPKSVRPHIGIFGRRNTGKSSLMNLLLGYEMAVVSDVPGTTTDLVEKSVEIAPIGPVVLIDTAGFDDEGSLGELRVKKTEDALGTVHLALLVTDGVWGDYERKLSAIFIARGLPFMIVWSKSDLGAPEAETTSMAQNELKAMLEAQAENSAEDAKATDAAKRDVPQISVSTQQQNCVKELAARMAELLPEEALAPPPMVRDLVGANEVCVFVAPIDSSAPKARLIAPQVQALRDLLDGHAISMLVQPQELATALKALAAPPRLVVTDSQAVAEAVRDTPPEIPLTTFSILMARLKGDLPTLAAGAAAIHKLKSGDKVCISEVCTHHSQPDDIGRVKIPALLKKFTGADLDIHFAAGRNFPAALSEYALIIHCGGCMVNRPAMLSRMAESLAHGTPVTNYGVAISLMQGVLARALQIFPEALKAYEQSRTSWTV